MSQTRTETNSLGEIEAPADRYYGAQTARSLIHFAIGTEAREQMPIEVIHALGFLKKGNALVNRDLGKLPPEKCDLIVRAAEEVIAIALGYEDLNDHQTLRSDPALQIAAGKLPDPAPTLASPPTLRRLDNRVDRPTLVKIADVLLDQFLASHATAPDHLILDFDATDDPVHGRQEGRFFHGYDDHHCFLPLSVFRGDWPTRFGCCSARRVRADAGVASPGVTGDGVGASPGRDDPLEAAQGGGACPDQHASGAVPPGQR